MMSIEESNNFECNQGIYNAYEYNKVDKDGVADISKRREMEKEINTVEIDGIKYTKKALELKMRLEYYREKISHMYAHEE